MPGAINGGAMMREADLQAGLNNLLRVCGGLEPGDRLLILHEEAGQDYYDPALPGIVARGAREMGVDTVLSVAPFDPMGGDVSPGLLQRMKDADRVLFLSRCGDQIRFSHEMGDIRPIMSYVLDAEMLGTGFGWASYRGFVTLRDAVNALLAKARHIRVTCPLGTDFSGPGAEMPRADGDVTVDRFPMLVHAPVPVAGFSGVVVQDGFLVGTGSKFYAPYECRLGRPIGVHFEGAEICDITGAAADVARAKAHYARVGDMFGLAPFSMHSWHTGIHPACAWPQPASASFERWSGSAFGNPRLLHVHTCGHYAPGEISLNVLDPTITVDGVAVWEAGRFDPAKVPGGAAILAQYPCIRAVFDAPRRDVGQGANGRLCGV